MRIVNILFLLTIAVLVMVPAGGLAQHAWRSLPELRAAYRAAGGLGQVADLAAATDRYVAANYGRRDDMIYFDARLRNAFGADTRHVAYGTDGFLFLKDDDVFSQATGQRVDWLAMQPLIHLATQLDADAKRRGRKFLFVVTPNKHTIYRRHLPVWARAAPKVTETDLLYDRLNALGIPALDLRDRLAADAERLPVYWRGDTHWTGLGMVIGFDAMAEALGFPQAALDAGKVYSGTQSVKRPGDLVRMAGLGKDWNDIAPKLAGKNPLSPGGLRSQVLGRFGAFHTVRISHEASEGARTGGPRVLVLGDSFTTKSFGPLFMRCASGYLWTHHRFGDFDGKPVEEFGPDIVILQVAERSIVAFHDRPATLAR